MNYIFDPIFRQKFEHYKSFAYDTGDFTKKVPTATCALRDR